MILHRGSRKAVRLCQSATWKFCFEELENRRLLTTIHGGDVMEFVNQAGLYTRVQATGPASAQFDLIGSTFQNGTYVLNDIPTLIQHPDGTTTPILGGVGGAVGQQPIQVVTGANESITDLIGNPALGLPGAQRPVAESPSIPSAPIPRAKPGDSTRSSSKQPAALLSASNWSTSITPTRQIRRTASRLPTPSSPPTSRRKSRRSRAQPARPQSTISSPAISFLPTTTCCTSPFRSTSCAPTRSAAVSPPRPSSS